MASSPVRPPSSSLGSASALFVPSSFWASRTNWASPSQSSPPGSRGATGKSVSGAAARAAPPQTQQRPRRQGGGSGSALKLPLAGSVFDYDRSLTLAPALLGFEVVAPGPGSCLDLSSKEVHDAASVHYRADPAKGRARTRSARAAATRNTLGTPSPARAPGARGGRRQGRCRYRFAFGRRGRLRKDASKHAMRQEALRALNGSGALPRAAALS
jgi:hypothetical protein